MKVCNVTSGHVFQVIHSVTSYMPYKKHIYWLKITLFSDVSDVSYSFDWLKITLFSDVIDVVEALLSCRVFCVCPQSCRAFRCKAR